MSPRRDQILAVMKREKCSVKEAVEICLTNFQRWRDKPRKWISLTTWSGGYFVSEDTEDK